MLPWVGRVGAATARGMEHWRRWPLHLVGLASSLPAPQPQLQLRHFLHAPLPCAAAGCAQGSQPRVDGCARACARLAGRAAAAAGLAGCVTLASGVGGRAAAACLAGTACLGHALAACACGGAPVGWQVSLPRPPASALHLPMPQATRWRALVARRRPSCTGRWMRRWRRAASASRPSRLAASCPWQTTGGWLHARAGRHACLTEHGGGRASGVRRACRLPTSCPGPRLHHHRWATAIEAALRWQLDSWVVDNHADAALLKVCLAAARTLALAGRAPGERVGCCC